MTTENETLSPCIDCGELSDTEEQIDGLCDDCWHLSLELIEGLDLEDALEIAFDMAFNDDQEEPTQ